MKVIDDVLTADDCKQVDSNDPCRTCAVARLLQRNGLPDSGVGADLVYLDWNAYKCIEMPIEVQQIVSDFDSGLDVVGRRVRLEIPEEGD